MNVPVLQPTELESLRSVFRRHPEISEVRLFGSRAKGNARPASDVDLAIWGQVDDRSVEAIAAELDELPLPYHYDVKSFASIKLQALREHIERVGITIFPTSG